MLDWGLVFNCVHNKAESSKYMGKMMHDHNWHKLVDAERVRQDAKWGFKPRSMERLYVILGEEFGELGKAIRERGNVDEEIIHVAAVAKLIWDTGEVFGYRTEKGDIL